MLFVDASATAAILDGTFRNIVEENFDAGVRLGESVEKDMIVLLSASTGAWSQLRHLSMSRLTACRTICRIWSATSASTCATRQPAGFMPGSLKGMVRNFASA